MTIELPRMRQQFAAQAVIEELLRQQSTTPPRTGFGRFFGYSPLGDESVSWYLGAQGEIVVGAILDALPPEWTVFHALPIGTKGADIDHLVIGPGGVFTINTKHHNGKAVWVVGRTLMVSGQKQPYIRNSEFESIGLWFAGQHRYHSPGSFSMSAEARARADIDEWRLPRRKQIAGSSSHSGLQLRWCAWQ
jgi:hypothetical protein